MSIPRYWHLAAFRNRDAPFGVGVVRRGNRITDLEFKLHVAAFRAAAPVPAVAAVADVLQGYSDAVHSNGRLTDARGARLLEAIRELVPGLRPTIQEFMQWVDGQPIPGAAGEQLGMEKDAIGTLLEVTGLNRSILTSWVDSGGETAFIHGLPQQLPPHAGAAPDEVSALHVTDAAEEDQPALPIEQPTTTRPERHHWVNEDLLIQFDHQRFADWIEVPSAQVGWRRYRNSSGTQTISVYYANRTPVESTLGTDLIYYHERHGCYVLLHDVGQGAIPAGKPAACIARHLGNPVFVELGKRLTALREKYAHAQQASLDFLKELLALARDTVAAEKTLAEVPPEERGKAALTKLFESLKGDDTPIIVENVVNEVDEVVRAVRFTGWQNTRDGDRLVQRALRKTLYIKFKIRDNDVFERALGYIREHY